MEELREHNRIVHSNPFIILLVLVLLATLLGCADPPPETVPAERRAAAEDTVEVDSPERTRAAFEGTTDETRVDAETTVTTLVADLDIGSRDGHDRIVFAFEDDNLPGYIIRYIDEATHCGSGEVIEVDGDAILAVQMSPSRAHEVIDNQRQPTLDADVYHPHHDAINHAAQFCDHHGGVSWAFGINGRQEYRVLTLDSPTRLVVDVLHPAAY